MAGPVGVPGVLKSVELRAFYNNKYEQGFIKYFFGNSGALFLLMQLDQSFGFRPKIS